MLVVETIAEIRRDYFVGKKGIKAIAPGIGRPCPDAVLRTQCGDNRQPFIIVHGQVN